MSEFGFSPFNFMNVLFPLFFLLVVGMIIFVIIRAITQWHSNNQQPVIPVQARVVTKRINTDIHQNNINNNDFSTTSSTTYYVTFEFTNGQRTELTVNGREYGQLAENDLGILSIQGTRYIGFQRQ